MSELSSDELSVDCAIVYVYKMVAVNTYQLLPWTSVSDVGLYIYIYTHRKWQMEHMGNMIYFSFDEFWYHVH